MLFIIMAAHDISNSEHLLNYANNNWEIELKNVIISVATMWGKDSS